MMKPYVLLACCLLPGLWTCSKDVDPPGTSPDPVFMIDAQIDGMPVAPVAGRDSIYLFTQASLGADNVWQLSGSFADVGCPAANCPGTLTFIWRNNAPGNDFDSTWTEAKFPFFQSKTSDSLFYRTHFQFNAGPVAAPEVLWNLNDSQDFTGPELLFDNDGGEIRVRATAIYTDGHQSSTTQFFNPVENTFCLSAGLTAQIDSPELILTALPPDTTLQYNWSNGNTGFNTAMPFTPGGSYTVTITNQSACTASVSLGDLSAFTTSVTAGTIQATAVKVLSNLLGGPIIEWIDPQGVVWRSDRGLQLYPEDYFEILEIRDYEKNEAGRPTKLLRVSWNCRLYDESGKEIPASGGGVIAVVWPG